MTNLPPPPPQEPEQPYGRHALTPQKELEVLRAENDRLKSELTAQREEARYYRGQLGEVAYAITGATVDTLRRDSKTQLLNTVGFERAVEAAKQTSTPKEVLFMDLIGFGKVNNELGHNRGDEVIIAVANTLNNSLRTGDKAPRDVQAKHVRDHDVLARAGGDEFIAITHVKEDDPKYSREDQVAEMTTRIRGNLQALFDRPEFSDVKALGVGVYVGHTEFDRNASAQELQERANAKMLEEKNAMKKAARAAELAREHTQVLEQEPPTKGLAALEAMKRAQVPQPGDDQRGGGRDPKTIHLGPEHRDPGSYLGR